MARAVALLSGGLDSYTAAAIAKAQRFTLYALTIHYGQRHARDRAMAAGFEHHGAARVEQAIHQRIHVLLQQRLAAGDLDQRAAGVVHRGDDLVHRHLAPYVERVRRVAPRAAQIARGQAHEHAGASCQGRFTLNRMENLVDC